MAKLKVTLIKSINKAKKKQVDTVKALGLRKIGSFVEHQDNAPFLGMIRAVAHLVKVEALQGGV